MDLIWIIIGGSAAYMMAWRITFRRMWEGEGQWPHDWEDFWWCVLGATFFCWALVTWSILERAAGRFDPDRAARVVGGESRAMKRKRRERELREREARKRKLAQDNEWAARKLGIGL